MDDNYSGDDNYSTDEEEDYEPDLDSLYNEIIDDVIADAEDHLDDDGYLGDCDDEGDYEDPYYEGY